jgi:integrase
MEDTMTPRKATLRVAHRRGCKNANQTSLDSLKGCTCKLGPGKQGPSYYVFHRGADGKPKKSARFTDRRVAEGELHAVQVTLDERKLEYAEKPQKNIAFPDWVSEWEGLLETRVRAGDLTDRTKRGYIDTAKAAAEKIGYIPVRAVDTPDLRRFYDSLAETKPASRARHLRQLSVCFAAAVDEGYASGNPVPGFTRRQKLRVPKRGKAPFEDVELERMWTAMRDSEMKIDPVYLSMFRFAVEMGGRLGELIGLDWSNVDVGRGRVRIESTYDARDGLRRPKDAEVRDVYLTTEARQVLEDWIRVAGVHETGPVFPSPETGGRMSERAAQRTLDRAMTKAGVPKEHPELRLPRSFHSLRYTTSVLMQRRGRHPRLIEQTLGHSSLQLTYGVYGGWTPDQLAEEAAR